ncbi:DUF2306 domain-containing protein [Parvularcula lutaonensis]|uniref:DUF2306 domain-containing protein n=1 Tax=Parvularcula lutaonensis TaxID=491923 RepID=A0ABV7MAU6_9PROT|nr:hypothetical protein [Parvularcula lutaonensis]GGY38124.1 membrane protein [Parvularcula lutaonensis]
MGIDWEPLWEAPWFLQVHALSALGALMLGTVQLLAPKGTLPHRSLGLVWIVLLVLVVATSWMTVWMFGDIRFSPIHVLSGITTIGLLAGIAHLVRGGPDLKRHGGAFRAIYIFGLVIAGAFTLMPGRIMHEVVFGG